VWRGAEVLRVPVGAVYRLGREWRVYRVDGGRARSVPVELGHSNGEFAEVKSGISRGTEVVLHPPDTLVDGCRVRAGAVAAGR
ncbi:MAG: hypothetical protein RLZZ253_3001, partial [Verrucomicrobiota bacterium]